MPDGTLGVALVGHSFMGATHSHAWRTAPRVADLPLGIDMAVVAGRDAGRAKSAASQLGWRDSTDDWRSVLTRDDVDLVDIVTPGDSHCEIAVAALEAGKHVLCEKPLANTVEEAQRMADAARAAATGGVLSMVGFNYRRVPAIALARKLVADGRLGSIRHVRAQYLQDWITDPEFPLVWRLQADRAGSGALGDIGAHIIDLSQFVTGARITGLTGLTETFVKQRPLPSESAGLSAGADSAGAMGEVTVDDAALFLARFSDGALGSFEATRFASGRKNAIRLEVNGSLGSVAFDFEQMNELWFHDHTLPAAEAGFRRIQTSEPDHPYAALWYPPGHGVGYDASFVHQVVDLVGDVAAGRAPSPSFDDGVQIQTVLDAVSRSSDQGTTWLDL